MRRDYNKKPAAGAESAIKKNFKTCKQRIVVYRYVSKRTKLLNKLFSYGGFNYH